MWKTIIIICAIIVAIFVVLKMFPKSTFAAAKKSKELAEEAKLKLVEAKVATVQKVAELDEKLATKLA